MYKNSYAENLENFILIPAGANTKEFYIGQFPVTNSQYKAFIDSEGIKAPRYWKNGTYPEGKGNHPVVFISYNDAMPYCKWLGKKNPKYSFRLPALEEWEYAASDNKGYICT